MIVNKIDNVEHAASERIGHGGEHSFRRILSETLDAWRNGASVDARAIIAAHPELHQCRSVLLDLAYEEYCLRIERGQEVDLAEYCGRFPEFRSTLRRQLEIHQLISEHPSLLRECAEISWPEPGEEVLEYSLLEELGRGAFARVFLAKERDLGGRQVVVKVCHQGADEAEILGKLANDNIVPIHSVRHDPQSDLTLICMPYLGRATLFDVVDLRSRAPAPRRAPEILATVQKTNGHQEGNGHHGKPNPWLRRGSYVSGVVGICEQIAKALAHAHTLGILHLDLKPSNVLLTSEGVPKLLDFNLASDLQVAEPRLGGTLPYMSPEQLRCFVEGPGASDIDQRSDIFSLGVILYELLSGDLPFGPADKGVASS